MKYIITEAQHKRLFEEEQKVLYIPDIKVFGNDWDALQRFLESKGNPPYSIGGNLDLSNSDIKSLRNLTSVDGNLDLSFSSIESLGNLTSVGGNLNLLYTEIESFENLISVGRTLYIIKTPLAEKYSEKEIRQLVNVGKNILS
jgi:hypothetical protein